MLTPAVKDTHRRTGRPRWLTPGETEAGQGDVRQHLCLYTKGTVPSCPKGYARDTDRGQAGDTVEGLSGPGSKLDKVNPEAQELT